MNVKEKHKHEESVKVKSKRKAKISLDTLESELNTHIRPTKYSSNELERLDKCLLFLNKCGADKSTTDDLMSLVYHHLQHYSKPTECSHVDFRMACIFLRNMSLGIPFKDNMNHETLALIGIILKNVCSDIREYKGYSRDLPNSIINSCLNRLSTRNQQSNINSINTDKAIENTSSNGCNKVNHNTQDIQNDSVLSDDMMIMQLPEINPLKMTKKEIESVSQSFIQWKKKSR